MRFMTAEKRFEITKKRVSTWSDKRCITFLKDRGYHVGHLKTTESLIAAVLEYMKDLS